MRFTVLGSGTSVPDPARGPAGFLVQAGGGAWLVDGGSGTLGRCMAAGVDPRTLDGGFYTHRHPDHCADLVPLLFSMRIGARDRDYPIWAAEGFDTFVDRLRELYGHWIAFDGGRAEVHPLSLAHPDRAEAGALTVVSRPANHSAGALHLRFEAEGAAVVFSGDTGPSDDLVALARGTDLLVCECACPDAAPIEGHLTPSGVAAIVDAARPAEVWLTHLYPDVDEALALATVSAVGVPVRRAADLDGFTPTRS